MWKALIKLIEKWSYSCDHNWENEKEVKTFNRFSDIPHIIEVTYRCTKCCKFKSRKL
jgi:hypothetical protein